MNIAIVGLGGTGSWLYPMLLKEINTLGNNYSHNIRLYDPDIVQERNIINQNFFPYDIGKRKVEVLLERYTDYYTPNMTLIAYTIKYPLNLSENILISCVDNNETRREINVNQNIGVWIDVGNDENYGQVVIINRTSKRQRSWVGDIKQILPDIALPTPEENTCTDLPPNNWWINKMAANVVMMLMRQILKQGYEWVRDLRMYGLTNNTIPILTTFEMDKMEMFYNPKIVKKKADKISQALEEKFSQVSTEKIKNEPLKVGDKVKVIKRSTRDCNSQGDYECCYKFIGKIGRITVINGNKITVRDFNWDNTSSAYCSAFSLDCLELVK